MAQYTCISIIAEIKERVGRTGDTVLVTDARIMRWMNEAQEIISAKCPGLTDLQFKNTTSLDTTGTLSYKLSDVTVGGGDTTAENRICHLENVWYIDGEDESLKLDFKPTDEFDDKWPDPTSVDAAKPHSWTRRGDNVEIMPFCASDYWDKGLRFDGFKWADDFTATDSTHVSAIKHADNGIIMYAEMKAWKEIGGEKGITEANAKYIDFFGGSYPENIGGWLGDFKSKSDLMIEWDGDTIFEVV